MLSSASHPSRHVLLIFAAVSLLLGGLGRTAAARDCTTDSDCDTGDQCIFGQATDGIGTVGGGVASSGGADAGLLSATPAVVGICQPKPIVCTSVADCPSADFDCAKDYIVTPTSPCPADTKCETPAPQMSDTGICVAKPHACSTAADCPAPLICQAEGAICSGSGTGGVGGPATTTADTCTPGPSVCTWVPVTCTADTGCADPLYQCVKVSEYGWCNSSGGTCAGGTCPTPEPETCGSTVIMNCMPKPIDCTCGPCPAGAACGACAACPAGWSCFDFSNYNGGVRPAWSPNAPDKSCLPDGIILATQGHASDGGQFAPNSAGGGGTAGLTPEQIGGAGGTGGNRGTGSDANPPTVNPVSSTRGAANANTDGGSALQPMAPSSGCAYGGSEAGPLSLWLALMAGLVVRLVRRRHHAR